MPDYQRISLNATVPEHLEGERLDFIAAELFQQYSRSHLQRWIKGGELQVDGKQLKAKERLFSDQVLQIEATIEIEAEEDKAQAIALVVVYEDDSILVINKPAGLVVHPAVGHSDNTLLNGLLHHCPSLADLPRAGIVHRLDKDTSGIMVVAKTAAAQESLIEQLQARTVNRHYYALVQGVITAGATIDAPIGRHPNNRQKQAVVTTGGKEAITHYRVEQRYRAQTLVRCQLESGRTHQIRVHMAYARYPVVGDRLYGGRPKLPKAAEPALIETLQQFPRQALHAYKLGLLHPDDGDYCEWEIPVAEDMQQLLDLLAADAKNV